MASSPSTAHSPLPAHHAQGQRDSSVTAPTHEQEQEHEHEHDNGEGEGALDEKPRLSEHEKKANHIASEQKRRQAIREGFDRLTELVPGLEGQGRSESVVLKKTVDYMRVQVEERGRLVRSLEERGVKIESRLRLR